MALGKAPVKVIAMATMMMAMVSMLPRVSDAALRCEREKIALSPCYGYLLGKEARPSYECCGGVERLNALANPRPDDKTVELCNCIQSAFDLYRAKDVPARTLARKCHVRMFIPLARRIHCRSIRLTGR